MVRSVGSNLSVPFCGRPFARRTAAVVVVDLAENCTWLVPGQPPRKARLVARNLTCGLQTRTAAR